MKKLYKYIIVVTMVCTSFFAKAQNDGLGFTLFPQIPYLNYYNPGIKMPYNGMVGVAFSNINVSMFNSSVDYKNIYGDSDDVIDAVKFANSLDDNNSINTNFSLDILNVGFRVEKLFFNIDWRMRMNSEFTFSQDFVGLFVFGNAHYMGADNPCDFNIGMDLAIFNEFAVGAQYEVNDKLTVGIRPKLLTGIANATVVNKGTQIFTDPNTFAMSANVDLDIKVSSLLQSDAEEIKDITKMLDSTSVGDFFNFTENFGLGVDFGASYTINEHIGVAAGIYDLGYIKWTEAKVKKVNKQNVMVNDALFDDYNDLKNFELDYESMLDDIVTNVWGDGSLEQGEDYKTYLKTKLMVQGYYELNPMVRATAIGQMYFVKGKVHPALTLAYSGSFWGHLDLTVNCTMSQYTGTALGAGFGVHFGPFNLYAVTDNILSLTTIGTSALEMASTYRQANARLGIVWSW